MPPVAKRVIAAATGSDAYWNLSDGEKLVWMIERAYELGVRTAKQNPRGRGQRRPRHAQRKR